MTAALAFLARLPWRYIIPALSVLTLLWAASAWHKREVRTARAEGATEQKRVDEAATLAAEKAATEMQQSIIDTLASTQSAITERIDHDHAAVVSVIDRGVADSLRRHAARQANLGGARADQATAIPDTASGNHEAYCAAAGWLSFERALSMAADAERDAAQARACTAWIDEQRAAWPAN